MASARVFSAKKRIEKSDNCFYKIVDAREVWMCAQARTTMERRSQKSVEHAHRLHYGLVLGANIDEIVHGDETILIHIKFLYSKNSKVNKRE